MIAKFVNDKKDTWSDFLDTSVFAYNTSRHASSKFTPFELMFNRRATIPIDIELRKEMSEELAAGYHELPEPDPAAMEEKRKNRLEEAKENILCAQKKQKEQYDKKHAKPHLFQPGQLVLQCVSIRQEPDCGYSCYNFQTDSIELCLSSEAVWRM